MKFILLCAFVGLISAQMKQDIAEVKPLEYSGEISSEENTENYTEVLPEIDDAPTPKPLPSKAAFKEMVEEKKLTAEKVNELEENRISLVCTCEGGFKDGDILDVTEDFMGSESPADTCDKICEFAKSKSVGKSRRKRQIGIFGYNSFPNFGFGGYFGGLPVGYGNLGFNLMGGWKGMGGCNYGCLAMGCGSFGGCHFGCARSWLPAPIAPLPIAPIPIAPLRAAPIAPIAPVAPINPIPYANPIPFAPMKSYPVPKVYAKPVPVVNTITVKRPVNVPVPKYVPVAVPRYVDVPVYRNIDVPVQRPVNVIRPVSVPVVRKVDVPVVRKINVVRAIPKPVPVIKPVIKPIQIAIPKPIRVAIPKPVAVQIPYPKPIAVAKPVAVRIPKPVAVPMQRRLIIKKRLLYRPAVARVSGVALVPVRGIPQRVAGGTGGLTALRLSSAGRPIAGGFAMGAPPLGIPVPVPASSKTTQ